MRILITKWIYGAYYTKTSCVVSTLICLPCACILTTLLLFVSRRALGCILWNLLTGIRLYSIPDPIDDSFTFFIRMNGLVDENLCNVALEELLDHRAPPNDDLLPRLQAVQVLSGVQRDLLHKLLQEDPAQRPTLDEILQHAFLQ